MFCQLLFHYIHKPGPPQILAPLEKISKRLDKIQLLIEFYSFKEKQITHH